MMEILILLCLTSLEYQIGHWPEVDSGPAGTSNVSLLKNSRLIPMMMMMMITLAFRE